MSTQIGTLVKLIRVMMLRLHCGVWSRPARRCTRRMLRGGLNSFRPYHGSIVAFFALATLRSLSLLPEAAIFPMRKVANVLTIMSMAGLGLGVDLRVLSRVGGRVTAAVTLSLSLIVVSLVCGSTSWSRPDETAITSTGLRTRPALPNTRR